MSKLVRKIYKTNDDRNKDFYNLYKAGINIVGVNGDGINTPLSLDYIDEVGDKYDENDKRSI